MKGKTQKRIFALALAVLLIVGIFADVPKKYIASAEGKHYVTHQEYVDYTGIYQHTCSLFEIDNTYTGYCIQHGINPPLTNQEVTTGPFAHASYDDLYKVLYYGYEGPEQWEGFTSTNHAIAATQKLLSYYYYDNTLVGDDYASFYYFLKEAEAPPSTDISFYPSYVDAYVQGDVQWTEWITFSADKRLSVELNLDEDMILYKKNDEVPYKGKVTLKGGESFYIEAPLSKNNAWNQDAVINEDFLFNIFIAIPVDNTLQSLVYKVPTKSSAYLQVDFSAVGDIEIYKGTSNESVVKNNSCYSLEGAVYSIYKKWQDAEDDVNAVAQITTDEKGYAAANKLPVGVYYLRETKSPKGYNIDSEIYQVEVKAGVSVTKEFKESPKLKPVSIVVEKKNQDGTPLRDAYFEVKYYDLYMDTDPALSGHKYKKKWVIKTDSRGIATFDDSYIVSGDNAYKDDDGIAVLPLGTITIEEVKAPTGYVLNSEIFVRQIESDDNNVIIYNPPQVKDEVMQQAFQIIKYGEMPDGKKVPLEKAGFMACPVELLQVDESGNYIWNEEVAVELTEDGSKILYTDAEGYAISKKLDFGTYLIRETHIPDNFYGAEDFLITIDKDSDKPMEAVYVIDKCFNAYIKVIKVDDSSGKSILNNSATFKVWSYELNDYVKFTCIIDGKETTVTELTTDENGVLVTPDVLPFGRYRIDEVVPPKNYYIENENSVDIVINKNAKYENYIDAAGNDTKIPVFEIEIMNTAYSGRIEIVKQGETRTWQEEKNMFQYGKEYLKDIEFAVYAYQDIFSPDDNSLVYKERELVEIITTDENGFAATNKKLPIGKYEVVELNTPKLYLPNENIIVDFTEETNISQIETNGITKKYICKNLNIDNSLLIPEISSKAQLTENELQDNICTISDIISYNNLIAGCEYTLKVTLMDKEQKTPVLIEGKPIEKSVTFIPDENSGNIEILLDVEKSILIDKTIVSFVDLYCDGSIVCTHRDLNNESQTVVYKEEPPKKEPPVDEPSTGDNSMILIFFFALVVSLILLFLVNFIYKKSDFKAIHK